jgi:glycosyltransferase involved in cell wall biosynthesis
VIPAFKKLLVDYPNALLILANAKRGDYAQEINTLLSELPRESYREIEFEYDLFALYRLFDVYVHVPIDPELEAFGQTYVEALAAGIPSVFTLSGVAPEFIEHERNALVVDFQNSEQIHQSICRLLDDKVLRTHLSTTGKSDVNARFSFSKMIARLEDIYGE